MTDYQENRTASGGSGDHNDEELQAEIYRRISDDPYLKGKDIQAVAYHGDVTLRGSVPTTMAAEHLIDVIKGTPGVRDVNQDLLAIGDEVPARPTGQFANQPARTVDEVIPADVPVTEEEAEVIGKDTVTTMHAVGDQAPVDENPNHTANADLIAASIAEGMQVVDRDGRKVGKVKQVRPTDFHLERGLLAKDYYVPYEVCVYDGEKIMLKIPADEISQQGWAVPGHTNDPYAGPLV